MFRLSHCLSVLICLFISCETATPENTSIYDGYDSFEQYDDLNVLNDYFEGLDCAKASERPIFLYFSAYGLGYDEFHNDLIYAEKIKKLLNDNFITIILYVDDRKKLTEIDTLNIDKEAHPKEFIECIKKSKTIGSIYINLQNVRYRSNSQPLYAIIDGEGNDLMPPFEYQRRNVDSFYNKLKIGLEVWNGE